MGINVGGNQPPDFESLKRAQSASSPDVAELLFGTYKKKVQIKKGRVRDVCAGLAEIAGSLGETNDEELYGEEMTEDLFEALKIVEKRQKKKKNNSN